MRIAIFAETYVPFINGVVTHVKVLKDGLTRLGHEVLIVTADPEARKHYIKDGVLHCPAHTMKRLYGFGMASPVSRKRMQLLKAFQPDVLHVQQEFGIGLFGVEAAKKLHKPLVYTLHTMYDEYLFYVVPKPLIPLAKPIAYKYFRWLAGRATYVTSPSAKAQEFFDRCKAHRKVRLVPNSVEIEAFNPAQFSEAELDQVRAELGIPKDAVTGIFVGRMGKEKSVDVLLGYWARFFRGDAGKRLLIVGDGPELENLEDEAKRLGIHSQVTFTGSVEHTHIAKYYAVCDFYVTASLSEMMSISMLEGAASGLPVVQRYDEKNANHYQEGLNSFTYKTEEQFEEIIRRMAEATEEEKHARKEAVRLSMKEKGETQLAKCLLKVYRAAIHKNNQAEA